jgi:hypothetical protein
MAGGALAATYHCSPDEAWEILVRTSQHTNLKVRLIAQALLDATRGRELPGAVRAQVTAAVGAVRSGQGPTSHVSSAGG